jgi:hypothetical protein
MRASKVSDNSAQSRLQKRVGDFSQTRKVRTGDPEFDQNRPQFEDFNSKQVKAPMGDPMSWIGDILAWIKNAVMNPNTWMLIGYGTAFGICLPLSAYSYSSVILPAIADSPLVSLGFLGQLSGGLLSLAIAAVIQYKELQPKLPKMDSQIAEQLAFKLGMTKFVNPKMDDSAPTLLPQATFWARNAAQHNHKRNVFIRYALLGFELIQAAFAFNLIGSGGVLSLGALIMIYLCTLGFEHFFGFGAAKEQIRLNTRESQQLALMRRQNRKDAQSRFK